MSVLALHLPLVRAAIAFGAIVIALAVGWFAYEAHVAILVDEDETPVADH